jgi:hypothetical protein
MDAKTKSPRDGGLTLPGEWHYAEYATSRGQDSDEPFWFCQQTHHAAP